MATKGGGIGTRLDRAMDVKRVHGELFVVVAGGTHHIRTPAAKGQGQPVVIDDPGEPITFVGQLCTSKDTMARHLPVSLKTGDVVEFLMHPKPSFPYVGG